jgi:3-oxoacyl-[acyl-carrier protein] reductase
MDLGISGRTAIVSASSKGLGKAVAKSLASEGAEVFMFSRNKQAIESAAAEIRSASPGARVHPLVADTNKQEELLRVVDEARTKTGRIDIVYNNAAGPKQGTSGQLADADWRQAMQDCLMSAVWLTQAALPHMKERKWGRVITGTSYSVRQPAPAMMLSNSLRSATTTWSKTLSDEVGREGITVNTIAPGFFETDRIISPEKGNAERTGKTVEEIRAERFKSLATGRYGAPEELGAIVAFLASNQAAYITGISLAVDGGLLRSVY